MLLEGTIKAQDMALVASSVASSCPGNRHLVYTNDILALLIGLMYLFLSISQGLEMDDVPLVNNSR